MRAWEMGNGEWEMGNGEWEMGNGEWLGERVVEALPWFLPG